MAMFRLVSKVIDVEEIIGGEPVTVRKRVKERVQYTEQDEADRLVDEAANEAEVAVQQTARKRKKLIANERTKALDTQIATERANIDAMDEAGLDARMTVEGLG